ncbi:hypothetical protein L226DRAFT_548358 [Lentinus tigrinus ALCF2SS1-7]|uniref:Uncharacterized protein n=1 Tax=Lentinus tigrinus ALCF2SS1-6 TaxID=1328759 RepID=A0A5C2S561_9APHY|nr:hypothetical protein L227DRAFT_654473 [Lentinus tigrinus ALCF2SS1-6]RPD68966.1 hypothetical protein L226DRAFT_548358 [Lentinus tigrinus ALCF2SS1-7]
MKYDQKVAWMRAKLRAIIRRRLRETTQNATAQMHYDTYWTHIVCQYGVVIDGWPEDLLPFCDPSRGSSSLARLEMLWIRWKRRSTGFRYATETEMDAFRTAGLFDRPARKRRSDYDVVRGRRRDPETRSKRLKFRVIKSARVVPEGADDESK